MDEDTVFIGQKDTMAYVYAVQTQAEKQDLIRIKARGRAIGRAVDVSQIFLNKKKEEWENNDVILATEERNDQIDSTQQQKVSTIEIVLKKI